MEDLKKTLKLIYKGETCFKPHNESDEALKLFQEKAQCLIYAKNKGFIEGIKTHTESKTGNNFYDLIIVTGGITYEGSCFLKGDSKAENSNKNIVINEIYLGDKKIIGDRFNNIKDSK
ncbi:hypothetical protein NON20_16075 [Synechocystis sp. B12]|nr:hypothetical protein NON20_16075 [Synechocystis sp. B12]